MPVTNSDVKKTYAGNGVTTAFSFPIYFLKNADLTVQIESADGTVTTQELTTDYTVTGAGVQAGGTVTMNTAPATGEILIIFRDPEDIQETDFQDFDIDPASAKEDAFDLRTMISQRQREMLGRAWILKESSTFSNLTVPDPESNKFLGWNSAGDAMVNKEVVATGTIDIPVPINQGGTGGITSNGALTALGGGSFGIALFKTATSNAGASLFGVDGFGEAASYNVGSNAGELLAFASNAKYPPYDGSSILGLQLQTSFTSSEQTLTAATTVTVAHGLGAIPKLAEARLVCKTAEYGYSVGEEIKIGWHHDASSYGISLSFDATNIYINIASGGIHWLKKDTFDGGFFTLANWKVKVLAWV